MALNIHSGSWFGLPDFGITEKVGSLLGSGRTSQGGSNIFGGSKAYVSPLPSGGSNNSGAVLGASTQQQGPIGPPPPPSSGQSSGSGFAAPSPTGESGLLEQAPQAPQDSDFDGLVAGALDALNQAEGALQGNLQANLGDIDTRSSGLKSDIASAKDAQLQGLQAQRTREQGRADSAISEARRLASQLQQGVQSRFGGSTSAGGAVSEILGSQAIQSIGGLRQSLQETLGQIDLAEQNVQAEATRQLDQIEREMLSLKQQAQADFRSQLANIAQQRGELESRKAAAKLDALENYRQQVAAINARNLDFQRSVQAKAANAASQIAQFRNQAQNKFEAYLQDPRNAFGAIQDGLVSPQTVSRINNLPQGFIQNPNQADSQTTESQQGQDPLASVFGV